MLKAFPIMLVTFSLLLGACSTSAPESPVASPALTLTSPPSLATPYADMPAAGICGVAQGVQVTISLEPGIASPRCVQVQANQTLAVVNATDEPLDISLGNFEATLAPGQSINIDQPFGEYLAKGVHLLGVSPCCGAEIALGIDLNS